MAYWYTGSAFFQIPQSYLVCATISTPNDCLLLQSDLVLFQTWAEKWQIESLIHPNVYISLSLTNVNPSIIPGAYEPPKAVKEHKTYASCQVPSQSKFIGHYNQLVSI